MKLHAPAFFLSLLMVLPMSVDAATPAVHGFTVRDMVALDRYSSPALSPDGGTLVFAKRSINAELTKASTALFVRNLRTRDLAPPKQLTPDGWNVNSPTFSSDGKTVYFLSAKSGTQQLYAIALAGGEPAQVTDFPLDVGTYRFSPDGRKLALSFDTFAGCKADLACTKKKLDEAAASKTTGKVFDRVFIRHWDTWSNGTQSRLFVADVPATGTKATSVVSLTDALDGDVPNKPFGDENDYAWAPDGKSLVASIRIAGKSEPWSTNFDLYLLDAAGKAAPKNLTAANKAWDAGPVFAHDGKTLFYRAMKRPGFEADRFGLMAMDLATGATREIAPEWDASANAIVLSPDDSTIYTTVQSVGQVPLFAVDVASGKVGTIAGEQGSITSFAIAGDTLVYSINSLKSGDQIFTSRIDGKSPRAITPSAGEMLPQVKFGDYEQFTFKGWNDDTVHGYIVKPWNYVKGRKYPVAFLIHGGPQGSFGNDWSYRWNPQTYAGQGYAVVMIDFHGSTGYGQAFTDAISQHWGDRPLEDLQKGWAAALQKYDFLDGDKACALGASYGGFMVNWIAGNWNQPWKCLVTHDGVFENHDMGFATEELWFGEWENGGTPWENPDGYQKFNPANFVGNFKVPQLVIHSEQDFRIPVSQGIGLFTALQRRGIESKFLYFPDENHWVLKPQNSLLWHDTVNDWLREHIGEGSAK